MRHFIFITNEGDTFQPNSHAIEPDVQNCQVMGFENGKNKYEAIQKFVMNNEWLQSTSFNEIITYELKNPAIITRFFLKDK